MLIVIILNVIMTSILIVIPSVILLPVICQYVIMKCDYANCHFDVCHFANCHFDVCQNANCHLDVCHYADCNFALSVSRGECYKKLFTSVINELS